MAALVTVNIRYTLPGADESDSVCLTLHVAPGARIDLDLTAEGPQKEAGEAAGTWKQAALRIVEQLPPGTWLSTSEIRVRWEADGVEIGRPALSAALGEMARRGEIGKRGTGSQTEYGALA